MNATHSSDPLDPVEGTAAPAAPAAVVAAGNPVQPLEREPLAFTLQGKELDGYARFHRHRCADKGRPVVTVAFTPTGLGNAVDVRCRCGKSRNITDKDAW